MKYIQSILIILLSSIALYLFVCITVCPSALASEQYLQLNGLSYHTYRGGQNEINSGYGLRWISERNISLSIGEYKNSYNNKSTYGTIGISHKIGIFEFATELTMVSGYIKNIVAPIPVLGIGPLKFKVIPKANPIITLSLEIPILGE